MTATRQLNAPTWPPKVTCSSPPPTPDHRIDADSPGAVASLGHNLATASTPVAMLNRGYPSARRWRAMISRWISLVPS